MHHELLPKLLMSEQDLIAVRLQLLDLQHHLLKRKYRADQARVPAGTSTGGQWVSEGGRTLSPALGNVATGVPSSPRATIQQAFLPAAAPIIVPAVEAGIEALLTLYAAWAIRNAPDQRAVMGFKARDYSVDPSGESFAPAFAGLLDRDQVREACPRLEEVQQRTDAAAAAFNRDDFRNAAEYGTAVHKNLKDQIDKLNDEDFVSERSYLKDRKILATYGQLGSIRIDVLENVDQQTVCVYDIKTGDRGLSAPRSLEIATSVKKNFPAAQRFIITEIRPSR